MATLFASLADRYQVVMEIHVSRGNLLTQLECGRSQMAIDQG